MKKYLTLLSLLFTLTLVAVNNQSWTPINFTKKGTKRLINKGQKKYYFYRSEKDDFLSTEISNQNMIKIELIEKKDNKPVSFTIAIDNVAKTFKVTAEKLIGKYWVFKPIKIPLTNQKHLIRINTDNRNAYFRIFRKSKEKIAVKSFRASKSKSVVLIDNNISKKKITFFSGDTNNPVVYTLKGGNRKIIGYAKSLLQENNEVGFKIILDGKNIETVYIQQKQSKKYTLKGKNLSRGKKFEINIPNGKHTLILTPLSNTKIFFRLNK